MNLKTKNFFDRNRQMYFHKEIFKTADVIVSPMTG